MQRSSKTGLGFYSEHVIKGNFATVQSCFDDAGFRRHQPDFEQFSVKELTVSKQVSKPRILRMPSQSRLLRNRNEWQQSPHSSRKCLAKAMSASSVGQPKQNYPLNEFTTLILKARGPRRGALGLEGTVLGPQSQL